MKEYQFKGKWNDELELEYLNMLSSDRFFKHEMWEKHRTTLKTGIVPLSIKDERTINPDPATEQINAINYILNNEEKIYISIFKSLIEIIIPDAKKYYDLKNEANETVEFWFPTLNSIDDMNKTIGIIEIEVDLEYRNERALTSYIFEFSGEQEHGLKMTFDGDNFLGFGDSTDNTMRKILTENQYVEYEQKLRIEQPLQIYNTDSKYGVLKPWQEYANDFYPIALLREGKKEELFKYLNNNPQIAKERMETLLNNSKALKLSEITNDLNEIKRKL